jgi:hypothetical protein
MKNYRIRTSRVVYAYYEIQADTEDAARELVADDSVEPMSEWVEDYAIDSVTATNGTCVACGLTEITPDSDGLCMDCAETVGA